MKSDEELKEEFKNAISKVQLIYGLGNLVILSDKELEEMADNILILWKQNQTKQF